MQEAHSTRNRQAHLSVYGAPTAIPARSIGFGPIMGTKRLCPEMTVANQYTLALSQVKHFKREGLTLSFLDDQNNLLIGFKKID